MRYALAALAIFLCACGSHHGADQHPPNAIFDRLVGSWSARCTASSGDYAATPVGTVRSFTVDNRGHLIGEGGIDVYLSADSAQSFTAQRTLANGRTEVIAIALTPAAPADTGGMNDGNGSAAWALTPISAPG